MKAEITWKYRGKFHNSLSSFHCSWRWVQHMKYLELACIEKRWGCYRLSVEVSECVKCSSLKKEFMHVTYIYWIKLLTQALCCTWLFKYLCYLWMQLSSSSCSFCRAPSPQLPQIATPNEQITTIKFSKFE